MSKKEKIKEKTKAKKVNIIGTGHVGLVTGACLAELGNRVICVDNNQEKIATLKRGEMPIYEPGLEQLVKRNIRAGRLSFTTSVKEGVDNSEIVFIAVHTPPKSDGEADLCYVEAVSKEVAQTMDGYKVIVEKSTVPVETGKWISRTVKLNNKKNISFDIVSNPEFLREGSAVYDFMHPDRIVLGVGSKKAERIMRELYQPLDAPIIVTDIESAEIIKHASNSFLAMKISYINSIANICEKVGADIKKVAEGIGYDGRIGRDFLDAGVGFGGACLPKDLQAFVGITQKLGYDFELLKVVEKINHQQKELLVKKVRDAVWNIKDKTIGILGLAFKPNTDDMRNAPSIEIIQMLQGEEAKIKAYDPVAIPVARGILKEVAYCKDPYDTANGCDALVILTEWEEFKRLDFNKIKKLMKAPILIDGRNIFEPEKMKRLGFIYKSIGRST
ncbi:UDP-glucose/GDP-mannose dehydrogenase family protein [bacterium]|nr:UDP-glucose/GDP-mannose dehydrogenase family protein [bacterium]